MYTTLKKINENKPCPYGWQKLLTHLGKRVPNNDPLPLSVILESNGFTDALWALRAVDGHEREIRLFAVWCARQVQHLITDPPSLNLLDVTERFANGEATVSELEAARALADSRVATSAAYTNPAYTPTYVAATAAFNAAVQAEAEAAHAAAKAAAKAGERAASQAFYDAARVAKAEQEAAFRKLIEEQPT